MPHHIGPWESTRASQEAEGAEEKHEQEPLLWFLQEGNGQGWVNRFRKGWFK